MVHNFGQFATKGEGFSPVELLKNEQIKILQEGNPGFRINI